jgi:hypothetical protein
MAVPERLPAGLAVASGNMMIIRPAGRGPRRRVPRRRYRRVNAATSHSRHPDHTSTSAKPAYGKRRPGRGGAAVSVTTAAPAPFADGLDADAVALGQDAGALGEAADIPLVWALGHQRGRGIGLLSGCWGASSWGANQGR